MAIILHKIKGKYYEFTDPLLRIYVELTWRFYRKKSRKSQLNRPLIVSLTSYPPRFDVLTSTLQTLLWQSVQPDRIILWIAHSDAAQLPSSVRRLESEGVTIRYCDDIRSFKKYFQAFKENPTSYVVTVDDDAYYWRNWLKELTNGICGVDVIPCFRAHTIVSSGGQVRPYSEWKHNIAASPPSPDTFPTGLGGVVYVPEHLHPDVHGIADALHLAPTADDIWLYFMARRAGLMFQKIGPRVRFRNWSGSQIVTLYSDNAAEGNANDQQFKALETKFGKVWHDGA